MVCLSPAVIRTICYVLCLPNLIESKRAYLLCIVQMQRPQLSRCVWEPHSFSTPVTLTRIVGNFSRKMHCTKLRMSSKNRRRERPPTHYWHRSVTSFLVYFWRRVPLLRLIYGLVALATLWPNVTPDFAGSNKATSKNLLYTSTRPCQRSAVSDCPYHY